jgi:hypothetical protein
MYFLLVYRLTDVLFSIQQVGKYNQFSLLFLSLSHSLEDITSYIIFLSILWLIMEFSNPLIANQDIYPLLFLLSDSAIQTEILFFTTFLSCLEFQGFEMYTNAQRLALTFTVI